MHVMSRVFKQFYVAIVIIMIATSAVIVVLDVDWMIVAIKSVRLNETKRRTLLKSV